MKINFEALMKRAGMALGAAVVTIAAQTQEQGRVPALTAGELAYVALMALMAQLPAGAGPLGIRTPVSPGAATLLGTLAGAVQSIADAPKERRRRALQAALQRDAVAIAGELLRTGEYVMTPQGLQLRNPADTQAPAPAAPSMPLPAPGYAYQAPAPVDPASGPEVPETGPRTLADAPQDLSAAGDAPAHFITGAASLNAFASDTPASEGAPS